MFDNVVESCEPPDSPESETHVLSMIHAFFLHMRLAQLRDCVHGFQNIFSLVQNTLHSCRVDEFVYEYVCS